MKKLMYKLRNLYFVANNKDDEKLIEKLNNDIDMVVLGDTEPMLSKYTNNIEKFKLYTPFYNENCFNFCDFISIEDLLYKDIIKTENSITSIFSANLPTKVIDRFLTSAKQTLNSRIKPLDATSYEMTPWKYLANECFYFESTSKSFMNLKAINSYRLIEGIEGTILCLSKSDEILDCFEKDLAGKFITIDCSPIIKIKTKEAMLEFLNEFEKFNYDLAIQIRLLIECSYIAENLSKTTCGGSYAHAEGYNTTATR